MFLVAALQYVKIADLTQHGQGSGAVAVGESLGDVIMSDDGERLPDGIEADREGLSREEERILVRESTARFSGSFRIMHYSIGRLINAMFQIGS